MVKAHLIVGALAMGLAVHSVFAVEKDRIELKTVTIKGNKELPNILYVVPWKDIKRKHKENDYKLTLHSLFGDFFDPVLPRQSSTGKRE